MNDTALMSDTNNPRIGRRPFLAGTLAAGALAASGGLISGAAASPVARRRAAQLGANGKLRVAAFGVGGMGSSDIGQVMSHPNAQIAMLCDTNRESLKKAAEKFPEARTFSDYREALAAMGDRIDAVIVSTPDHTHAPIALNAMDQGKACYCQKPLTKFIAETRAMQELAAARKVATQMGIQRGTGKGLRTAVDMLRKGIPGKIVSIHTWTNRPAGWWPQGQPRPEGKDEIPAWLDWQAWLGGAPERPYKADAYTPFKWRGVLDFGTGALGDMACHFFDTLFLGIKLGTPVAVMGNSTDLTADQYPVAETVTITFAGGADAANGEIPLTWYDGGRVPPSSVSPHLPKDLDIASINPDGGSIIVGTDATVIVPCDTFGRGENEKAPKFDFTDGFPKVFPNSRLDGYERPQFEPYNHWHVWVDAAMGKGTTVANFDLAAPLTEAVLLGVIGGRVPGQRLVYDPVGMRFMNSEAATALVRPNYRAGFDKVPVVGVA